MRRVKSIFLLTLFALMTAHNLVPHHHVQTEAPDHKHLSDVHDHGEVTNNLISLLFHNHSHTSHNQTKQYEPFYPDLKRTEASQLVVPAYLTTSNQFTVCLTSKRWIYEEHAEPSNEVFSGPSAQLRAPPVQG